MPSRSRPEEKEEAAVVAVLLRPTTLAVEVVEVEAGALDVLETVAVEDEGTGAAAAAAGGGGGRERVTVTCEDEKRET